MGCPLVPHPLSSTHPFNTKGTFLFSPRNPSFQHALQFNTKKTVSMLNWKVFGSLRRVLNWEVRWTDGCVELRCFGCWKGVVFVLNSGVLCGTEGYSIKCVGGHKTLRFANNQDRFKLLTCSMEFIALNLKWF